MEEVAEMTKENAIKAKIPGIVIAGTENQYELKPWKIKSPR